MEKLREIRGLDAHVLDNPTYLELFHRIADIALNKLRPFSIKKEVRKKARIDRAGSCLKSNAACGAINRL
jgi:hypothetical protein